MLLKYLISGSQAAKRTDDYAITVHMIWAFSVDASNILKNWLLQMFIHNTTTKLLGHVLILEQRMVMNIVRVKLHFHRIWISAEMTLLK